MTLESVFLLTQVTMGQLSDDLAAGSKLLSKIETCTEKTQLHKAVWDQVLVQCPSLKLYIVFDFFSFVKKIEKN
jgi:hypothetical protein